MKLVTLSALAFQIFIFSPQATCQENKTQPERLYMTISAPPHRFYMSASSIERDLSSTASAAVLQLKGNVEIRVVTCLPGEGTAHSCPSAMLVSADEAEYHEKTGEIVPRGNVHVSPAAP